MEIDDNKRLNLFILFALILTALWGISMGWILRDNKINKLNVVPITSVSAVASPIFMGTQSYGTYMMVDSQLSMVNQIDYDFMADQVIACESGGEMKWGDLNYKENGVSIPSYGVAQFQLRTFNMLKVKANKPFINYYSEQDQKWLLKYALVNGFGNLWTCYRNMSIV